MLAAVDIGANSVRLKIARLTRRGFEVIEEDREVTRLGQSVFRGGLIAPEAMGHTVKVLRRFYRAAHAHGVTAVRVVGTSSLRDARNAEEFITWVKSAVGWTVEVISGLEEGRLIHLGIISRTRVSVPRLLLIDLGGGSCELTLSAKGHIREMFSLPLGAVRLTGEFLAHDPPRSKEVERLREFIAEEVANVAPKIAAAHVQLTIATSGTAAALAASARALWAVRSKPRGTDTTRSAVVTLTNELMHMKRAERAQLPGIGTRRTEIIVAGALVFVELMQRCELRSFRYSPLGLRDGLLAQMAADAYSNLPLRKRIQSDRWDALISVCQHYQVDLEHAQKVRELALDLFHGLRALHKLPEDYAEWLSAAAMLHETGDFINRSGRHRHTRYIIGHTELLGYTRAQRVLTANIARYLGKSKPSAGDRTLKSLSESERIRLARAAALLRLAMALNQSRRGVISKVQVRMRDGQVNLRLSARRHGAALELWAVEKQRAYFREVFGAELSAELS